MYKPDYEKLRGETVFSWNVSAGYLAFLDATGISQKEMFLTPSAGIELYKKGRRILKEMFGPDVDMPPPMTPPISYGHINTLGAELVFPENGEVNHGTLCDTLEECIAILKKPVDFTRSGMFPFYLDYQSKLQEAFPDEKACFAFKAEGPLTTAYTARRDEFFYDFYDNPERTKEFLGLLTESIVKYIRAVSKQIGVNPDGAGLADDCAAMLGPDLWPEFVIPCLEQYYRGLTSGRRSAHIEDLHPEHLKFLEELELVSYDPSVSAKINPRIISEKTRVPFRWRLIEFCYPYLDTQDVSDFVYQSVADGASGVFTCVLDGMCNNESVEKIHSFISACRNTEKMLKENASRQEISELVSPAGKKKFWDNWPCGKQSG